MGAVSSAPAATLGSDSALFLPCDCDVDATGSVFEDFLPPSSEASGSIPPAFDESDWVKFKMPLASVRISSMLSATSVRLIVGQKHENPPMTVSLMLRCSTAFAVLYERVTIPLREDGHTRNVPGSFCSRVAVASCSTSCGKYQDL